MNNADPELEAVLTRSSETAAAEEAARKAKAEDDELYQRLQDRAMTRAELLREEKEFGQRIHKTVVCDLTKEITALRNILHLSDQDSQALLEMEEQIAAQAEEDRYCFRMTIYLSTKTSWTDTRMVTGPNCRRSECGKKRKMRSWHVSSNLNAQTKKLVRSPQ